MNKKELKGVVVSNKMAKTVVVAVTRLKLHKKYKRYHKITSHFKAHNEGSELLIGQPVTIQETRPLSKDKRWVIKYKK